MAVPIKDANNVTTPIWTRQTDGQDIQGVDSRPASGIATGRKTVAVAGTRETLVGVSTPCWEVTIEALSTNTGVVVVGGSAVVAAAGTRQGNSLSTNGIVGDSISIKIDDVQKVYIDVTVSTEGVTYSYLTAPVDPG